LLGKEKLSMVRKIQLPRIASHHRVKVGQLSGGLWPQDPAQPLGFFLA
jgi:hypothetical protein